MLAESEKFDLLKDSCSNGCAGTRLFGDCIIISGEMREL